MTMSILRTCIGCEKVFMAVADPVTKRWPHTCGSDCDTESRNIPLYDVNWDDNPFQKHDERGLPVNFMVQIS